MKLERIPHIYHNTIYAKKIFEIIEDKQIRIKHMFYELSIFNDLNIIKGKMLDLKGNNFLISRNSLNDDIYRKEIKFRISLFNFFGNINDIITILSEYFNLEKEEFRIIELSAKILISIPESLNKQDVFNIVSKIKSAGIGLEIKYGIYVEDYLITELHELNLDEIEKITLARGEYYIEFFSLNELSEKTIEEISKLKISRR